MLPSAELEQPICLYSTYTQQDAVVVYRQVAESASALFEHATKAARDSERQTDEVHCSFVKSFFGLFITEGGINASFGGA